MTDTLHSDAQSGATSQFINLKAERLKLANALSDLTGILSMAEPSTVIGPRLTSTIELIERYRQVLQESEAALGQSLTRLEAMFEQHAQTIERLGLHAPLAQFRQQAERSTSPDKVALIDSVCGVIESAALRDSAWQDSQAKLADAVTNMKYDAIGDLGKQAEEAKTVRDRTIADLNSLLGRNRTGADQAAPTAKPPADALLEAAE